MWVDFFDDFGIYRVVIKVSVDYIMGVFIGVCDVIWNLVWMVFMFVYEGKNWGWIIIVLCF